MSTRRNFWCILAGLPLLAAFGRQAKAQAPADSPTGMIANRVAT